MRRLPLAIVIGVLWTSLALAASLMPQGKQAYFDANGDPLAGGKVYTYAAGTSTPLETYSDQAGTTPNANPVVLDSRGEATIFWGAGPYKVTVNTSADVLVWTQDNLYPPFTVGEALGGTLKLYSGGNAGEPELVWGDDTNSGFYLIGADNLGLSIGGTKRWDFGTAGTTLTGTFDVTGATSVGSTLSIGGTTTFLTGAVSGAVTFADPVTLSSATSSTHAATRAYADSVGWRRVVLTADVTNDQTSITNVTGLSFSVSSGKRYLVRVRAFVYAAAATTGTCLNFKSTGAPTTSSLYWILHSGASGTGGVEGWMGKTFSDTGQCTANTVSTDSTQPGIVDIDLQMVTTSTGTMQLVIASEVGGSAVGIKEGSYIEWYEVP